MSTQAIRDALAEAHEKRFLSLIVSASDVAALLKELDAAKADAERYRWLRQNGGYEPPTRGDKDGYSEFRAFFWTNSKTLDEAIDAKTSAALTPSIGEQG